MNLLEVKDLSVQFDTLDGTVSAVNGISFNLKAGETLGIVGESGSGKSQTVFALMGLIARNGKTTGSIKYNGQEILNLPEKQLNKIRAQQISMIFQDPMTSLNPYTRVSDQLAEVLIHHKGMSKKQALAESVQMLDAVKIPEAKSRIHLYPHEFSGGMRQRVMIAMALLCKPKLLIADEPTTALDVTVQAQIMTLLSELQQELKTAIILITHDLGVIAGSCEEMLVMYGGRVMEYGNIKKVFSDPAHPYTKGLLHAIPRIDHQGSQLTTIPGSPPNMLRLPKGCPFEPRCDVASDTCRNEIPALQEFSKNRYRACHSAMEV
ncbi:MAG: oligopeptide ABC transporter ATP-binding protein OppD [Gammaproteobacteria bacterium]|jgi:oligopeptide transport system ATP-binding protein|nr:oligopeptide ABC transporter ATP-binding protein OppD [Gammaproteobacteria bacterium]MBT3724219.1 oligopeptide ABC transporter ATP-binding protein OppD [Gammaproteobacteria bacterium]MBT4077994.1 oligopeptide ABC transporter ATP-binding protein OppD [Gammaproteobacteria bacterium]MBT4194922.1 oligopeptide ABC transporter ATP-binding protein OppD [Gammaproteobacteria bacterium]MBT4450740.1 oligopeptide ABC transporter ATP-binding protein OppD [Gammaproteobacteria bacterium]